MIDYKKESLKLHLKSKGKIEVVSKVPLNNKDDLSLAYTPGVAEPCVHIAKDSEDAYKYTSKGNMVAVVSDGSAVLGLGNIGALASLPVMEGKALLFKEFANVDAFPIVLDTQNPDEIIEIVKAISPTFGGINLEDIEAPKCVYIERRLKEELNIPVFHDDQHGTAIVLAAALINATRLTKRRIEDLEVVLAGTGAAGNSIARMLKKLGVKHVFAFNKSGVLSHDKYNEYNFLDQELLDLNIISEPSNTEKTSLEKLIVKKDVFIGVSAKGILSKEMVRTMHKDPFIFAMANPDPEITYEDAVDAGAFIIGTGRSDYPNQINNVLAFPGIFRGALDSRAKNITEEMKLSAAKAIAHIITDDELSRDYIIPSAFNKEVVKRVSREIINHVKGVK
ncbi:NAD-dependent malic enzyme [Candidatus Izimaplasma bacterium ZiA1]|uniref:NAD(P)-dependent malic enzyme n=1 Tax=Candidatus Izimoplasma sp. ZiA1 TaxID=2024899 RepID=UPI000BAA38D7|nr:NAD-dependent malic enzyme [Candidatus Izimaplasma bacterium ZiA1]